MVTSPPNASARVWPATPKAPPTKRSRGCSSGTRTNCATSASRWRPAGSRRSTPAEGYRINRNAYALPDIELTAEEAAAVAVAAQLWESPELITATQGALLKLRAAGVDVDPDAAVAITTATGPPGLRGSEDVLGILLSAIDSRQAVRFQHRPLPTEPHVERTVEPWGVVTARGRWYLVGHDRDRNATRTFRLSRIDAGVQTVGPAGSVTRPDGVDLRAIVENAIGEAPSGGDRDGVGGRRPGDRAAPDGDVEGLAHDRRRAGEVIELDLGTRDRLTREIAGYGADALVLEPAALRADVVARLTAQADRA